MLFRCVEVSAQRRADTEDIEIIAGDFVSLGSGYHVAPDERRAGISVNGGHAAEGGVAPSVILEGGIRRCEQATGHPLAMANLIEAIRVPDVERAQEERIEHSEDYDISSDSKRERDQGYQCEGGGFPENTNGVADVEQQVIHLVKAYAKALRITSRLLATAVSGFSLPSISNEIQPWNPDCLSVLAIRL